jgi:hypothetical protein
MNLTDSDLGGMQLIECSDSKTVRRHPFIEKTLDAELESVNQGSAGGRNKDIKITGAGEKRRWTLASPGAEEQPTDSPFYSRLPAIGIADLGW